MNLEGIVPYLLVAAGIFLIPKIPGMFGGKSASAAPRQTFVPHYTYVAAALIMLGILLYIVVRAIIALISRAA